MKVMWLQLGAGILLALGSWAVIRYLVRTERDEGLGHVSDGWRRDQRRREP